MLASLRVAVLPVLALVACARIQPGDAAPATSTSVGPPRGSVVVVGGGALGPEIYSRFIELAGGPNALIVEIPTAGGDTTYGPDYAGTRAWKAAGARNVVVLHTIDRKVPDTDAFVAPLTRAGGVWFDGGRQYRLVDAYGGTKTEIALQNVLARGGVIGGSSAGATILGSFLVRGAPSNNNLIMEYPGYQRGFGYLRNTGIDQHVVARDRLADFADSLMPRYPDLLGISEDEGTAWVVRGDTGVVIGRGKAFVYGGKDATDPGAPYLTVHPGDRYDLGARRMIRRAIDETALTVDFVDSVFSAFGRPGAPPAAVHVAQGGRILVSRAYGVPRHPKHTPGTTVPNFSLGMLSGAIDALAVQLLVRDGKLRLDDPATDGQRGGSVRELVSSSSTPETRAMVATLVLRKGGVAFDQHVSRRAFAPLGIRRSVARPDGWMESNVDELYRLELGLQQPRVLGRDEANARPSRVAIDPALGWQADVYRGMPRLALFGASGGKQHAFVRLPGRQLSIIILTGSDTTDARALADRVLDRLADDK
jgi:cyanophycinase